MRHSRKRFASCVSDCWLRGCGSKRSDAPPTIPEDEVLGEVATLLRRHQEQHNWPAATPTELEAYGSSLSNGYSALLGWQCILIWGVSLSDDPPRLPACSPITRTSRHREAMC